jgi:hypothetical protein
VHKQSYITLQNAEVGGSSQTIVHFSTEMLVVHRELYQQNLLMIRGRLREIVILNVHKPTEDKSHHTKEDHRNILLGISVQKQKDNIFKPTIGNVIHVKLVMIMGLDYRTMFHQKI